MIASLPTDVWEMISKGAQKQVFCIPILDKYIPTGSEIQQSIDVIEEIIFIGYPIGLYDTVNFLPIVRKGITATPILMDYNGKKAFLIDASVFPGSSGSPIFIYKKGPYGTKDGALAFGDHLFFTGVLRAGYSISEEGEWEFVDVTRFPRIIMKQSVDLGWVTKAEVLLNFCRNLIQTQTSEKKNSSV